MSPTTGLRELLADRTRLAAPELIEELGEGRLRCLACGHRCRIATARHGVCHVRFNRDGELRVPWGYVAGVQLDPIEKKPFFHFLPGEEALSFGMLGCDYHCSYCQNWISSQTLRDPRAKASARPCEPGDLVDLASEHGSRIVVSTYNEPLITSEWAVSVFERAKERDMACAFVSNGNATPEVLGYLQPFVDAYKVDLKGFDDGRYRQLGGVLAHVLDTIAGLKERGIWLEVVTLIVPGFNDGDEELTSIARFLAGVDRAIPWHVTAFHPDYKMADRGRTPAQSLERAHAIGQAEGLRFVYAGNLPGGVGDREDTFCPSCEAALIRRTGFRVRAAGFVNGACGECGEAIDGIWTWPPGP